VNYRTLGKTGLRVSEIGFGSGPIGNKAGHWGAVDDRTSLATLRRFFDLGGNFMDTSESYGDGHSEEIIGRAIRDIPRDQAIIATKCWKGKSGFSYNGILASCEGSLKRLGVDCIDVYQLHSPGIEDLKKDDCFDALRKLREDGKVRCIAVAAGSRDEEVALILPHKIDAWQITLNLLDHRAKRNFLPAYREHGIGVISRLPLQRGFLSGKYTVDSTFREDDQRSGWPRERIVDTVHKVDALRFLVGGPVKTMAQAAQRWVLMYPEVSTIITGAKTPDQVAENCAVSDLPSFAQDQMQRVDALHATWR